MSESPYLPEKWLWTDADFEVMGWHDCRVHALALLHESSELCLDIDYIMHWVNPVLPERHYTFWVVPATVVFENVGNINVEMLPGLPALTLSEITREHPYTPPGGSIVQWSWTLDANEGDSTFIADGYKQYLRRSPLPSVGQVLTLDERGGRSFDRMTWGAS